MMRKSLWHFRTGILIPPPKTPLLFLTPRNFSASISSVLILRWRLHAGLSAPLAQRHIKQQATVSLRQIEVTVFPLCRSPTVVISDESLTWPYLECCTLPFHLRAVIPRSLVKSILILSTKQTVSSFVAGLEHLPVTSCMSWFSI